MAVEKTLPGVNAGRTVLVTGGAGYIGTHAVLQLLLAGFRAVVVDNLNNSSELAVRRVAALAGDHSRNLSFHKVTTRPHSSSPSFFFFFPVDLSLPRWPFPRNVTVRPH